MRECNSGTRLKIMIRLSLLFSFIVALSLTAPGGLVAAEKEVTIGYQKIYNPWKIIIADRLLEKSTDYRINWRAFSSGAKVTEAMAAGQVQIAMAGSSPIAAAVSNGLQAELFWIVEDIADAEALVVRDGSGIVAPRDLRGKRLAVPFVSTAHFHTLFAMEQFGLDPVEVELLNMPPDAIASAWDSGRIDAAFIWNPTLGRIKQTGKVLVTSGTLNRWGKATFDGMIAMKDWAVVNPDFMKTFVSALAAADEDYRNNREEWTADSEPIRKITRVVGGTTRDAVDGLSLYRFPDMQEQVSDKWLGGGDSGGAAQALYHTSAFLLAEKKIDRMLESYGSAVNPKWVSEALEP